MRIPTDPIGIPNDFIVLTYRPNYLDHEAYEHDKELDKTPVEERDFIRNAFERFVRLVSAWDVLVPDRSSPVPLTVEGLFANHIPFRLTNYLISEINQDFTLAPTSVQPGGAGTPPAADLATTQNPSTGST